MNIRQNQGINPWIPGLSKFNPEIPGLAKRSGIAFPSHKAMVTKTVAHSPLHQNFRKHPKLLLQHSKTNISRRLKVMITVLLTQTCYHHWYTFNSFSDNVVRVIWWHRHEVTQFFWSWNIVVSLICWWFCGISHLADSFCFMILLTGRGLFLLDSKPRGSFLVEYYGELIDATEGHERERCDDSVFRYFIRHKKKQWWYVLFWLLASVLLHVCIFVFAHQMNGSKKRSFPFILTVYAKAIKSAYCTRPGRRAASWCCVALRLGTN